MRINFKNIKFKNELAKGYIESNIDVDLISFVAIIQKNKILFLFDEWIIFMQR